MFDNVILQALNGQIKGQEFVLENEADYTLGRSRDCSCVVPDPLCLVSRRHCRIMVHAPLVTVQDLGSRNGTWVNGNRLVRRVLPDPREEDHYQQGPEQSLVEGDTLEIAGYEFRVSFATRPLCSVSQRADSACLCASH